MDSAMETGSNDDVAGSAAQDQGPVSAASATDASSSSPSSSPSVSASSSSSSVSASSSSSSVSASSSSSSASSSVIASSSSVSSSSVLASSSSVSDSSSTPAVESSDSSASAVDGEGRTRRGQVVNQQVRNGRVCAVCGDRAIANNFGASSCESCKAFFRRNALKQERQQCVFQKQCVVEKSTRRFCPACRLDKCFLVGMLPQLILGEQAKKARLAKRQQKCSQKEKPRDSVGDTHTLQTGHLGNARVSQTAAPIHPSAPSQTVSSAPVSPSHLSQTLCQATRLSSPSSIASPLLPPPPHSPASVATLFSPPSESHAIATHLLSPLPFSDASVATPNLSPPPHIQASAVTPLFSPPPLSQPSIVTLHLSPPPFSQPSVDTPLFSPPPLSQPSVDTPLPAPPPAQTPFAPPFPPQPASQTFVATPLSPATPPSPVSLSPFSTPPSAPSPSYIDAFLQQALAGSNPSSHEFNNRDSIPAAAQPWAACPQSAQASHRSETAAPTSSFHRPAGEPDDVGDSGHGRGTADGDSEGRSAEETSLRGDDDDPSPTSSSKRVTFQHVRREELPSDMKQYWLPSEEERFQLTHLCAAYENTMMTLAEREPGKPTPRGPRTPLSMDDYMNLLDNVLHLCVRFAKAVPEFQRLPQADQISILKASALQTYGVAACSMFIPEQEVFLTQFGHVGKEHFPPTLYSQAFIGKVLEFCHHLKAVAKNEVAVYALLHCLVLFDPCQTSVEDRQLVNALRDKYVILLKHYLESQYSYLHANRYFSVLVDILVQVRQLGQQGRAFYTQIAEGVFKPLSAEIFSSD